MNAASAEAWLTIRLQPSIEPSLTEGEMAGLLSVAAVTDVDGLGPTDAEWVPTYSLQGLYRAASEGWKVKAGKATGHYDFTTDGQQFRRSQVVDHCESQAALWAKKAALSVPLRSAE